MNLYRFTFTATCPVNGQAIAYTAEIRTERTLPVEELNTWRLDQRSGFHEDIADRMQHRFGGRQSLVAVHHGVTIETERP